MVRHINDHIPMGASVSLSADQLNSLACVIEDMFTPLREIAQEMLAKKSEEASAAPAPVAVLSTEQFDELKSLLQPGFELSKLMLADYTAQRAAALIAAPGEKDPPLTEENLQS